MGALACQSLEKRLPAAEGGWSIEQLSYDYVIDEDVVGGQDSSMYGRIWFYENGSGELLPGNDSSRLENITWKQLSDSQVRLEFERTRFEGLGTFDFRIEENQARTQLWRAEEPGRIYNPLRRDSSDTRLLVQLEMLRLD